MVLDYSEAEQVEIESLIYTRSKVHLLRSDIAAANQMGRYEIVTMTDCLLMRVDRADCFDIESELELVLDDDDVVVVEAEAAIASRGGSPWRR